MTVFEPQLLMFLAAGNALLQKGCGVQLLQVNRAAIL
jgi:hypothetical protein